jgi:hypothetical protein
MMTPVLSYLCQKYDSYPFSWVAPSPCKRLVPLSDYYEDSERIGFSTRSVSRIPSPLDVVACLGVLLIVYKLIACHSPQRTLPSPHPYDGIAESSYQVCYDGREVRHVDLGFNIPVSPCTQNLQAIILYIPSRVPALTACYSPLCLSTPGKPLS